MKVKELINSAVAEYGNRFRPRGSRRKKAALRAFRRALKDYAGDLWTRRHWIQDWK